MLIDPLAAHIGRRARAARERLDFTQAEVAELIDMSLTVYNRLERGRMLPSVRRLVVLCEALKTSPDDLLGFIDSFEGDADQPDKPDKVEPPSVHHLTRLARRMDGRQRQALITIAKVMLR
jgi:transcriptional regulator with XRE-family HTH domain